MRVHFWGVRGSIPAPQTPKQIRSKISAIVERISAKDLESPESRERFLSNLPPWLFGTMGGNTPCVEVRVDEDIPLIFDAGSGIRELGISINQELYKPKVLHLFFSHLHWDHVQGLPFFAPAYNPSLRIEFYSPHGDIEEALSKQMSTPFFPVGLDAMGAVKVFHHLKGETRIGRATINCKVMSHPGKSYSYVVTDGTKRFIYATDTELSSEDFLRNDENASFFGGADLLVIDSQYTLGEAIEKYNWGHNSFSLAVDFASNWGINRVVLFHHDPTYSDKKLHGIVQSARWYTDHMAIKGVEIILAVEGMELTV